MNKSINKKAFYKQLATLIFIAVVLVIVLFKFFNDSFGWFANNKNVNGTEMTAQVDYDDFYVSAEYYKRDMKTNEVLGPLDIFNENTKDDTVLGTGIVCNPYDVVFRTRNRYNPVVVVLKMHGDDLSEEGRITIRIDRDVSVDPNGYTTEADNKYMSEYFSSIMRVTPLLGAEYYSVDPDDLYTDIDSSENNNYVRGLIGNVSSFGTNPQSSVFTTITLDNDKISSVTKEEYLEFQLDYTSSDFISENGVPTLVAYLYITYDEGYSLTTQGDNTVTEYNGLIGIFQKTSKALGISSGTSILDTSIDFKNDIKTIKVTHE